MSLPEALLKWLSLANHQDSNLTALQVSDGITMSQVLNKIDPKHFTQVTPNQVIPNYCSGDHKYSPKNQIYVQNFANSSKLESFYSISEVGACLVAEPDKVLGWRTKRMGC